MLENWPTVFYSISFLNPEESQRLTSQKQRIFPENSSEVLSTFERRLCATPQRKVPKRKSTNTYFYILALIILISLIICTQIARNYFGISHEDDSNKCSIKSKSSVDSMKSGKPADLQDSLETTINEPELE